MEIPQVKKKLREIFELKKDDPVALGRWLFDSLYWEKQEEIMNSVWENERTAVKSCNSGGKSRISAEIALLYLLRFRPSRVITTAPTFLQVEQILWKEIHALYHKSRIPFRGDLTKTTLNMGTHDGRPWDMIGISTNEENRMQGYKSPHLLVIGDEALGLDPIICRAIEGLVPHRILMIGNPLDAVGDFYDYFNSPLWNKITIDGLECIKWQEKHGSIPGLITRKWYEERKEEWGEGSAEFQARCRGEFPENVQDALVQRKWIEKCRKVELLEDEDKYDAKISAWDIASRRGKNRTVRCWRVGNNVKSIKPYPTITRHETRDMMAWDYKDKKALIVFDGDGMGEGFDELLGHLRVPFYDFHGGYAQKAITSSKFRNLRTQFYWIIARKLEKGLISLKEIPEKEYLMLLTQLPQIKVRPCDAQGRIQIETKEDMHARGVDSPDESDALMMSEYGLYMSNVGDIKPIPYR